MIWIILIAIIVFVAFKLGSTSGQLIESVNSSGGMRMKYSKLLEWILGGHKESKIFVETRTYLRAGVSNYGGTTLFHIQQTPGNKVIIQYEIKNNPTVSPYQLQWTFPDDMDQDEMINIISLGIYEKIING